jgi:hypothetical protein
MSLLGRSHRLCESQNRGGRRISVRARYVADIPAEVEVALVTPNSHFRAYLPALRALVVSMRVCRAAWSASNGKSGFIGRDPDCPKEGRFF